MSLLSAVRDSLDTSQADYARTKEQLDFLLAAAKGKLDFYQSELKLDFQTDSGTSPIKIIGDPIVYMQDYRCNVGQDANAGITDAINSFFGGSSADVKAGFQSLIGVALQAILGDTSMGESEQDQTVITIEHNAIVRIDIRAWRYNFSDQSVIGTVQNAFCYVFCKSVVDHTKVTIDTLLYLISEAAGDDLTKVQTLIDALKSTYAALGSVSPQDARASFATSALSAQ
ncbi:MAG TPA: hypothetical protein VJ850_08380 [Candidatus Limnocylindrales bacterium]|nr:hypothetical protein [Candidatus Limnocylindrales bacterium]